MDIFAGGVSFDGRTLYQGDIVLDLRTRLIIQGGHMRRKRAAKKFKTSRWPNGEIPYVVDRNLGKEKYIKKVTITKYQSHRYCITSDSLKESAKERSRDERKVTFGDLAVNNNPNQVSLA